MAGRLVVPHWAIGALGGLTAIVVTGSGGATIFLAVFAHEISAIRIREAVRMPAIFGNPSRSKRVRLGVMASVSYSHCKWDVSRCVSGGVMDSSPGWAERAFSLGRARGRGVTSRRRWAFQAARDAPRRACGRSSRAKGARGLDRLVLGAREDAPGDSRHCSPPIRVSAGRPENPPAIRRANAAERLP